MSTRSLPGPGHALWHQISTRISQCTGRPFEIETARTVSGGCINHSAVVTDGATSYFVKVNAPETLQMFEAEEEGLRELARANALRVPTPVCSGRDEDYAWLVLEYLGAMHAGTAAGWSMLGRGLAEMHQLRQSRFGWHRNNTIGTTPQVNAYTEDWTAFLRDQRIGYQLELAFRNGYRASLEARGESLLANLHHFFAGYAPQASLLHGDLWSGNAGFAADGSPVVFDPAVYYGDRETDIAMTELFGGFAPAFHHAYQATWPLDIGYASRKHLYNLYHLLNHLNLFGEGYLPECQTTIERLLADVR